IGSKRVSAASAYPINFTEAPTYQRIYVDTGSAKPSDPPGIDPSAAESDSAIENAIAEATEQLHDDMAYEFEMRWQLWAAEEPSPTSSRFNIPADDDPDSPDPDFDFDA